ncbi:hypothetical protein I8J29_25105 [Paenibacillus sp. MWE-103]|uniref:SpoIIAA-like protein n=1 Tax=Paenibacillus artemisiicola TaxID=1172618 RepID=A0ABS3WGP2_9BACL|nr:hypothetical protein [Paenibacillus artemisiicola]MBO7747470.1 hypothetical protein [Paenibacillus artemisiicola]
MTHYFSDEAYVFWDDVLEAVVIRWHAMAEMDRLSAVMTRAIELAKAKRARKVLVDTRHLAGLSPQDARWMTEEWSARLAEAGIRYAAAALPDFANPLMTKSEHRNAATAEQTELLHPFPELNQAIAWLSGIPA